MTKEFIAYLHSHVGKSIYVWGGQGETNISEEWIHKREKGDEGNIARVLAFWQKLKQSGTQSIHAFDCSGLIMHFLQDIKGIFKSDMSAAGLYRTGHIITKGELMPGDLVFRHNGNKIFHVGVFVGDSTVIECKGRDYGVVACDVDHFGRNYWNRYARLALPAPSAPEAHALPTEETEVSVSAIP